MAYKVVFKDNYLCHENPNHDPKTGQFTFAKASQVGKTVKNTTDALNSGLNSFSKSSKGPRADLSNMSDEDLRKILNREEMERRYDTYFNTPKERKGLDYLMTALTVIGTLGATTAAITAGIQGVKNLTKQEKKEAEKKN